MIPSFEIENLKHFEDCLNLPITDSYEVCQRQLLEYKNTNYPDWSNLEFGCYLYETYGKFVVAKSKEANDIADNQLNRELSSIKEPTDDYITHEVGKAKLVKSGDYLIYPRDGRVSARALKNARYKCENNENHECFIRKSNGKPYTEVHHLIPLCYHYRFKCSLDVTENIISLCSNCHNEIHYGKDANKLIEKFYNERKANLHDAGIDITLDELLDMY